jgi:hypothetical protein
MQTIAFWSGTYQTESPTDRRLKLVHVSGVSPIGFLILYLSVFVIFFSVSLITYPETKWLQLAAIIWLAAGFMGTLALHTNMKELVHILKTVEPIKAKLKDGMISGDTCWEIVDQSNNNANTRDSHVWWTRYQNGLFSDQPADVFIYPYNGSIAIEDASNIALVIVDAKRLIK